MEFPNIIHLVFRFLYIETTSDSKTMHHSASVDVTLYSSQDEDMEIQLQRAYNFLSNLELISYKCSQPEFFNIDLVELESGEYFLRIGVLPKYLHPGNFDQQIDLQKFSLFDRTNDIEIISSDKVRLMSLGGFMGFKIANYVKDKIKETIEGNILPRTIEVRIQINKKIQEIVIEEIKLTDCGHVLTTTDTIFANKGLILEKFPCFSKINDNKHFLAFLIYTISKIIDNPVKERTYCNGKEIFFEQCVFPPMFVLLKAFRQDLFFLYGKNRVKKIFFELETQIDLYPSHILYYMIEGYKTHSSMFNIKKYMYTDTFDQNLLDIEEHIDRPVERKSYITIRVNTYNIWNIEIKTYVEKTDLNKLNSIAFLFRENRRKTYKINFDFDRKQRISQDEILHSLIIERPTNHLLNLLTILKKVVDSGEGNIVFHFLQEKKIKSTYAICFDKGNCNILILRNPHGFPNSLLPAYFPNISR